MTRENQVTGMKVSATSVHINRRCNHAFLEHALDLASVLRKSKVTSICCSYRCLIVLCNRLVKLALEFAVVVNLGALKVAIPPSARTVRQVRTVKGLPNGLLCAIWALKDIAKAQGIIFEARQIVNLVRFLEPVIHSLGSGAQAVPVPPISCPNVVFGIFLAEFVGQAEPSVATLAMGLFICRAIVDLDSMITCAHIGPARVVAFVFVEKDIA